MTASSAWSGVTAEAYEGLLGPAGEAELGGLAAAFRGVYAAREPRRLCVVGVGTGHELACVDVRLTGRVVGVDPNLGFLGVARQRLVRLGATLHLHCAEVEGVALPPASVDLVYAGWCLEWTDLSAALPRMAAWLAPGGALAAVLHLPGGGRSLADSSDHALRAAAAAERAIAPGDLRARCAALGLVEASGTELALGRGLAVHIGVYERLR